jgi:peptide chain release factor subunit 1
MFQCEEDTAIEQWKLRRLIKSLDASSGAGTSAITLIVRSGQDINLTNQKVKEELGEATNIKSRVNRGSVLSAFTSIQQRLNATARLLKMALSSSAER